MYSPRVPAAAEPRVAFVSSHAGLGGSERYLELLLAALDRAFVDRVVFLEDGPAVARLQGLGHPVRVVPAGRRAGLVAGAARLRRELRGRRPDVVHANGVKAALVAGLGLAGTGIPVLWVKHDFSWDGRPARLVARGCGEVVGVSEAVLHTLRDGTRGRRAPKLTVVPNGIPEPEADAARGREALRALGAGDGDGVVLLLGRLHPAKGQIELVEAAPSLLAQAPGARIVLAGGEDPHQPAYARRVRARVSELGLGEQVLLAGHRQDALDLIAAARAVVVPSVRDEQGMGREGFGLVGVEALALGTPVAGYADGALPEVLGDAAALVSPGDRDALAAAITRLLTDGPWREGLARRGRRRFEERYRIERTAAAMAERYRALARS